MTAHTPGPWIMSHGGMEGDEGFSIASDNATARDVRVVAECWPCTIVGGEHRKELAANGHLIAAAPDLMAVCQKICRALQLVPCKDGGKDAYEGEPGSMVAGKWRAESSDDGWAAELRTAIAKATGETTSATDSHTV